jgi:hypothetical protein
MVGGTAPDQVAAQVVVARQRMDETRAWIGQQAARLPTLESVTAG